MRVADIKNHYEKCWGTRSELADFKAGLIWQVPPGFTRCSFSIRMTGAMKTANEMAKTLYLGDRACKRIIIDGWRRLFAIEVNRISRIRNPSGEWGFYSDEDIVDGMIVFEGVSSFEFAPSGFVPSDWIEFVTVDQLSERSAGASEFKAVLSLGAIDQQGNAKEVSLTVCASSLHLEDPSRPGVKIVE
jgi:hypothetical protein